MTHYDKNFATNLIYAAQFLSDEFGGAWEHSWELADVVAEYTAWEQKEVYDKHANGWLDMPMDFESAIYDYVVPTMKAIVNGLQKQNKGGIIEPSQNKTENNMEKQTTYDASGVLVIVPHIKSHKPLTGEEYLSEIKKIVEESHVFDSFDLGPIGDNLYLDGDYRCEEADDVADCGDEEIVAALKEKIEEGENKQKMFVYQSEWMDGEEFSSIVHIRLFSSKEKAIKALHDDLPHIMNVFLSEYDKDDVEVTDCGIMVEMNAYNASDFWCGSVFEKEVE